jgi:hypothetical protein
MNQLDLFATEIEAAPELPSAEVAPPPAPELPPVDVAPPLIATHREKHFQALADFYLSAMNQLGQLMVTDYRPALQESRRHEMARLNQLRQDNLAKLHPDPKQSGTP